MTVVPVQSVSAPALLRLTRLSDAEDATRARLSGQLRAVRAANLRQEAFYEGSRVARDLGIAIPPHLRDVETVAAWPEIVVDVIDERMNWRGWRTNAALGLDQVYEDNHLAIEVGQATLDALIFGLSYLSVGTGDDDEPDVLVKAESPKLLTATWDPRLRRATEALREVKTDATAGMTGFVLMLPDETITVEWASNGTFRVTDRDQHGRGRVPVSVLRNRPRASRVTGRSEITRAVRSATESGMRTLLGMEVAREFYAAAQRYILGADESMFKDMDGNRKSVWEAMLGKALVLPRNEETGEIPSVGEFTASSPQPFTEILKTYAQQISAATGIPATHLGFATDNPTSADAIDRADRRMNERAKRRQAQYNLGLVELGNLAVLWRDGELPAPRQIRSLWVRPDALSPNAAADRAVKMVSTGSLDPSWDFTLEQFGLSDEEIQRVRQERLRTAGRSAVERLAVAAAAARQDPQLVALESASGTPAG